MYNSHFLCDQDQQGWIFAVRDRMYLFRKGVKDVSFYGTYVTYWNANCNRFDTREIQFLNSPLTRAFAFTDRTGSGRPFTIKHKKNFLNLKLIDMESLTETQLYNESHETSVSRVAWSAIFGGTLIMLITLMLLSLLGVGVGIGSINQMEESQPLQGVGTGALIWWIISNILAVFAGAHTAARLTNVSYQYSGIAHGVLAWSLYTLISFLLMTSSIGGIISGVGGAVSKGLSAVGVGVSELSSLADQVNADRMNRLIQDALAEDQELGSETTRGKQFDIDIMAVGREVFTKDGEINTNINRAELEQSVARNSTLSKQDAKSASDVIMREFEQIEKEYQQMKEKAKETAYEVAEAVSKAAIWSFVALLLGVITAAFGGYLGKPEGVFIQSSTRTTRS